MNITFPLILVSAMATSALSVASLHQHLVLHPVAKRQRPSIGG